MLPATFRLFLSRYGLFWRNWLALEQNCFKVGFMKIATWNINGIKARLHHLLEWLERYEPDIVCLQEIKTTDETFPRADIETLGYHVATSGQKSFNGVALLAKRNPDDIARDFDDGVADEQSRFIEGVYSTDFGIVRIASLYLPNGNPSFQDGHISDKYAYKLDWMARFEAHVKKRLALEEVLILAGDYNVIPSPTDAAQIEAWADDALYLPKTREKFRNILHLGLTDALRQTSDKKAYSFWDYQAGSWRKDNGIRIDHILLSPEATDRMSGAFIQKELRGQEKPSDHVPVWLALDGNLA